MSTIEQPVTAIPQSRTERKGSILAYWLSSTDHKIIGHLYLITSFFFFLVAGVMALLMRIQLLGPDQHFISDQQYNELFTMHGTLMLLLFATPMFVGLRSWTLITSAMIPASRKKMNDVIRYRCPMILWSVEDSQPARIEPLRSVRAARAVTARRAADGSSRVVTGCSLKLSGSPSAGRSIAGTALVSRSSA